MKQAKLIMTMVLFSISNLANAVEIVSCDQLRDARIEALKNGEETIIRPNISFAKKEIQRVFDKYLNEIADWVKKDRPILKDYTPHEILSGANCGPASRALFYMIRNRFCLRGWNTGGMHAQIKWSHKHAYIEVPVEKDGKPEILIVDPTFRQHYIPDIGLKYLNMGKPIQWKNGEPKFDLSEFAGLPLLMMASKTDFKHKMESFRLTPFWKLEKDQYYRFVKEVYNRADMPIDENPFAHMLYAPRFDIWYYKF